ncbi:MAG: lipoxygenase family protein [Cyanobacteria bacterium J06635_10]
MTFLLQNEQENFGYDSKSDKSKVETDDSSNKNSPKLKAPRRKYQYNYTYIPSIAMVDKLPRQEYPSIAWVRLVAEQLTTLGINILLNSKSKIFQIFRNNVLKNLIKLIVQVIAIWVVYPLLRIIVFLESNPLLNLIFQLPFLNLIFELDFGLLITKLLFSRLYVKSEPIENVKSLQEYNNLFKEIELPDIAHDFQEDETFAYMQVAGYNPVMIEQVKQLEKLEEKFPVTEAQYQQVMGTDDSLTAAIEEGRLYLADYQSLEGAANGTFPREQKYVYAPLALFAVPKDTDSFRLMRSVAIQCTQNPKDELIFTPKSGKYAWLFAKTIVQMANSNFHEALSHLGRTHLFVGRFAIGEADTFGVSQLIASYQTIMLLVYCSVRILRVLY